MINHLIEKIKTYVDLNTDEFIVDFLGLKKKGYNRCVCPFCEHKDAGMSYFKSGFWGCYHANCEANGGAGDSITLATLVLNGHTPETYKRLSAENFVLPKSYNPSVSCADSSPYTGEPFGEILLEV